jgi:demethylmenaquinone methyltransferase/2-methoxy-6-polyprenyl-1,4-benzoquinol methylase
LGEMHRVLKPNGKLLILEFGQPSNQVFGKVYGFYSAFVLPVLGGMVSGKKDAYQYLNKTSLEFPCGNSFCELVKTSSNFSSCRFESLSFGIAYIYILVK